MLKLHSAFEDAISDGSLKNTETLIDMTRELMMINHDLRGKAYRNLLRFIEPFSAHTLATEEEWLGTCPLETILSIPSHLYEGNTVLSERLIAAHNSAYAKFNARPMNDLAFDESCVICGSIIAFEDPFEARCKGENMHRFGASISSPNVLSAL